MTVRGVIVETLTQDVVKNSVAIFDSVKQGNDHIEAVDTPQFIDRLCSYSDLQDSGSYVVCPRKATKIHISTDKNEKPKQKKKKYAKKAA